MPGNITQGPTQMESRQSAEGALRDHIQRQRRKLEGLEALLTFLESQPTLAGTPADEALWSMILKLHWD